MGVSGLPVTGLIDVCLALKRELSNVWPAVGVEPAIM